MNECLQWESLVKNSERYFRERGTGLSTPLLLALHFESKLTKIGPIELELFEFKIETVPLYTLYYLAKKSCPLL